MTTSVQVGAATIIALSDMEKAYPAEQVYPAMDAGAWEPYRDLLTASGEVLLNFGCYVIRADGRTVLVDTGWGPTLNGALLDDLRAASVALAEIDTVVFTHLHGDHIGWNVIIDGGTTRPRFPRARYLAPEADYRTFSAEPSPSALFREQMIPLASLGVMELTSGERVLSPSVTIVPTPGHTPGRQSVAVLSGHERALVLGDVTVSLLEVMDPTRSSRFDADGAVAAITRQTLLARLEQDGALVAASHLPKPGLGRVVRVHGQRIWQPLASA